MGLDLRYQMRLKPFGENSSFDDYRVGTHQTPESATDRQQKI
jgi:hypothetical protein